MICLPCSSQGVIAELEEQPKHELRNASLVHCVSNFSKRWRGNGTARRAELRVIEEIEESNPELKVLSRISR